MLFLNKLKKYEIRQGDWKNMLQSDIKRKNVIIRTVTLMLTIVVCMVIFTFSSEDSGESTGTSDFFIECIIDSNPFTKALDNMQKEEIKENMKMPIRKLAHFSIYTVLGITIMCHMSTYDINRYKRIGGSLMVGMLYAVSDEIHQLFVPGRSGQVSDVCIDTVGVLFGICIFLLIKNVVRKMRGKN